MDRRRSVTDKPHDDVLRQAGLVAARYERDARAMKTEMTEPNPFEEKPPGFTGHRRHSKRELPFFGFKASKERSEFLCQRRSKVFASLSVEGNSTSFKIDIAKRHTRLRETAALIPRNRVRDLHPLWRSVQRLRDDFMFSRRYRGLYCNRLFADAETRTRVVVGKSGLNCLPHHDSEQLHLVQSGIVTTGRKLTVRIGSACLSPVDEIPHMLSGQLTWRNNISAVQKRTDVFPAVEVTVVCLGRRLVTLF